MKKYKLFIFTIAIAIMSIITVNARSMTVAELGQAALDQYKDKGQDVGYIYVIGEYAFTSQYDIKTEDIMLAAKSINLDGKDPVKFVEGSTNLTEAYKKMVINTIRAQVGDDFTINGWEIATAAVGTTNVNKEDKLNIRYIDYVFQPETSKAEIKFDKATEEKFKQVLNETYGISELTALYEEPFTYENNKLTGLLLKYNIDDKAGFIGDDKTGYYLPFVIEVENANTSTTVELKGAKHTVKATYDNFDATAENGSGTSSLLVLWSIDPKTDLENRKIEILIDLDGEGKEYEATPYTIDYSDISFQEDSTYTVSLETATDADKEEMSGWGYNSSLNQNVKLDNGELTGKLVEQVLNADVYGKEKEAGYYFDFTLVLPDGVDTSKVLVEALTSSELNGKENIKKTFTNTDYDENGNLTILVRFEPNTTCPAEGDNCKLYFKIDLDGEGKKYLPVLYTIDYSKVTFEKSSIFTVEGLSDGSKFPDENGWYDAEDGYSVSVTVDDQDAKKYNVSGVLPIIEDDGWTENKFDKDQELYYLGLLLKLVNAPESFNQEEGTITIKFFHEDAENDDQQFVYTTGEDFGTSKSLYILKALSEVSEGDKKEFTITLDIDGAGKEEYAPYTVTIDWSNLKLQTVSKPNVSLNNASTKDKETLQSWSYNDEANINLSLDDKGKLTGTMKEQTLSTSAFGEDKINGYYFNFTFVLPAGVSKDKVKISHLEKGELESSSSSKKEFTSKDYNEENNLNILFQIPTDVDCKNGKENNCKIYYSVDYDGDEKAYLPTLYTIDYSEVTFQKSSLVQISSVESIGGEEWNQFEIDDKYSAEFAEVGSTFKVTGLITMFDDEWKDSTNPFESGAEDYYLAFKLTKVEGVREEEDSKTIVKFLTKGSGHGDKDTITHEDFGDNNSIYVLKYLNPNTDYDNKKFEITIDYDGEEGIAFAPYTITIDWSELDFQYESSFTETEVVNSTATEEQDGYISQKDKDEIQKWGYNFDNAGKDLKIGTGTVSEPWKLTGSVKEQNVQNAGFSDANGYYVALNIYGPSTEQAEGNHFLSQENGLKHWTIILKDENGEDRTEYTPTTDEYNAGFVTVLFKLKEKDSDHKITIKIDWDGSNSDVYLPYEEIIDYSELNYLSLNTITYNYKNKNGEDKTEKVNVYEGENVTPKVMTEESTKYRNFTKWTDEEGQDKTTTFTTEHDKDKTLNAHWELDVDAFLEDVVADLNNADSEISENYTNKFVVSKDGNTITFDVKDATMLLSDMDNTTIPGAIAYILNKGEIKDITLATNIKDKTNQSVKFTKDGANNEIQSVALESDLETLKSSIKTGANALFSAVLTDDLETMTINKMAVNDNGYKLTIGVTDENVTLKNTDNTSYEFKFASDLAVVKSEKELKEAIESHVKNIEIVESFTVNEKQSVNREVNIYGKDDTTTLTGTDELDSMFEISAQNVNISNLKIKSTKKAITVLSGGTLTFADVDLSENTEAGIEVKNGGTVSGNNLKMTDETYEKPAIKAEKTGTTTVRLTASDGQLASKIEKEKITTNNTGNDEKAKDEEYNYNNYYNEPKNSKIYKTELYNYQAGFRVSIVKYSYYNEKVNIPDIEPFKTFTRDGETYELIAFTEKSNNVLRGDETHVDGDIKKDELTATKDNAHYWAVFKVALQAGIKKVNSEQAFKDAIKDAGTHAIYVSSNSADELVIDYTSDENEGTLKIDRDLSIIGPSNLKVTIKANKIETTAAATNVFMNRINLEISAKDKQEALIEVNGSRFSLWQSNLKNTGNAVDYAIKYNNQTSSIVDIRYVGTGGSKFTGDNINKGYIYVSGKMDEGSTLISNTFPSIEGKVTAAIIINDFTEKAIIEGNEDGEPDIRFEGNTVNTKYAIVFTKNTADKKADIKLGNSQIKVGLEYASDKKNFSGIGLFANQSNVTFTYIDGDNEQQETEVKPEGVQDPTFKAIVEMTKS